MACHRFGFSSKSKEKQLDGFKQRSDRIQWAPSGTDVAAMRRNWKGTREGAGKPLRRLAISQPEAELVGSEEGAQQEAKMGVCGR